MHESKEVVDPVDPRKELSTTKECGGFADGQWELQAHLAEYQALTTRITYWITLQFSVIPITGGALLLLAGTGKIFSPLTTIWFASAIMEVGIAAYLDTLYEMMSTGQYVECELAGRIRKAMPGTPVWQFELFKKGNHIYSPDGIYLLTMPGFGIPFIALWLHWKYWSPLSGLGDSIGFIICLGLSGVAFMIARKASRAQKGLWECAGKAGKLLAPK